MNTKKTIATIATFVLVSNVAFAFKPLITVLKEDLQHIPLLVNYTTTADTVSFTLFFKETGVFENVWDPTLSLRDSKRAILFEGGLATSSSIADESVTEIHFKARADSIAESTFMLHADAGNDRSVAFVFPLSLLVDHFRGHAEGGTVDIGAEANALKQYFQRECDPAPVVDKIEAVWKKAEK